MLKLNTGSVAAFTLCVMSWFPISTTSFWHLNMILLRGFVLLFTYKIIIYLVRRLVTYISHIASNTHLVPCKLFPRRPTVTDDPFALPDDDDDEAELTESSESGESEPDEEDDMDLTEQPRLRSNFVDDEADDDEEEEGEAMLQLDDEDTGDGGIEDSDSDE